MLIYIYYDGECRLLGVGIFFITLKYIKLILYTMTGLPKCSGPDQEAVPKTKSDVWAFGQILRSGLIQGLSDNTC